MDEKPSNPAKDKKERLKQALRANLKRRKQQARQRGQDLDVSSTSSGKTNSPGKQN